MVPLTPKHEPNALGKHGDDMDAGRFLEALHGLDADQARRAFTLYAGAGSPHCYPLTEADATALGGHAPNIGQLAHLYFGEPVSAAPGGSWGASKDELLRVRTSINTRQSPCLAIISISPPRQRKLVSIM